MGINEKFTIYDFFRVLREEIGDVDANLIKYRRKVNELGLKLEDLLQPPSLFSF